MTKKIAFFCGTLSEGGGERVISILANHLAEKGCDVEIILYYDRPIFYTINKKIKITIIERKTKKKNKLYNAVWLRNYFKKKNVTVISFFAPINMYIIATLFFCKIPLIVADRNDPREIPSNFIVRKTRDFLYNFADGVVLQTEKNKSYFPKKVQRRSTVIYNPLSTNIEFGIALNTLKKKEIVSVGRLREQKNQLLLIDAFNEICKKHGDYNLVIYGEGPFRKELEKRIRELNLTERVFLPGQVQDVIHKIASAEIFVLPSNFEGMSNALLEAMAIGLPVVATNVSGTEELIKNDENGIIIEKGDKEALIKSIVKLIDNPLQREHIGKQASESLLQLKSNAILDKWTDYIYKISKSEK